MPMSHNHRNSPLGVCKSLIIADERKITGDEFGGKMFPWYVKDGSKHQHKSYAELAGEHLAQGVLRGTPVNVETIPVVDREGISRLFSSSTIVLLAMEVYHPRLFAEVNAVALRARKPVMYSFVDGSIAFVGPLMIPGETSCYVCLESLLESNILSQSTFQSVKSYVEGVEENGSDSRIGGMPPLHDVMAGFLVDAIVRYLFQASSVPFLDRMLCIDFDTLEMKVEDILKNPACPACSDLESPQTAPIIR